MQLWLGHLVSRLHGGKSNGSICAVGCVICTPSPAKMNIDSYIMSRTTAKSLVSYLRPSTTNSDGSILHEMVYKGLGRAHR